MSLVKYEEKFLIKMSDKNEFHISKKEMNLFTECANAKWVYEMKDWTLINTSFFMSASPFEDLNMTDREAKKISEKETSVWWKVSNEKRIEWLKTLRDWGVLFN